MHTEIPSKKRRKISIDIKLNAFSVSQVTGASGIGSGGACCGACATDTDAKRRSASWTVDSRFTLSCPDFLFGLGMDAWGCARGHGMREAMRKGGDTTATAKTAELWRSAPSAEIQRERNGEAQAAATTAASTAVAATSHFSSYSPFFLSLSVFLSLFLPLALVLSLSLSPGASARAQTHTHTHTKQHHQ